MIDVITNIFLFIEVIESPTIKIVVYSLILGEHKLKKT